MSGQPYDVFFIKFHAWREVLPHHVHWGKLPVAAFMHIQWFDDFASRCADVGAAEMDAG